MQDQAYQKEYDEARAKLDAEAAQATTPRDEQGKFTKTEVVEDKEPEAKAEQQVDSKVDPLEEIRLKLEKTEKALKDTQKWGHENAQRLREIEQERERQQREAAKPKILEANPELEQAIRFVASDPAPQQQASNQHQQWQEIVEKAHPGIFTLPDEDELVKALVARRESVGSEWQDPLVAIREITAEKLAHTERQIGKRFAAESAKLAQKSAMSVPGAGSGSVAHTPPNPDLAEAQRILKMSPAEFEREVRRVKGY